MPHPKIQGNLIGKYLKYYRKKADITQVQLSAALSIDHKIELAPDLISRIESGERAVRDKELYAITLALDITPNQLFGLTTNK